MGQERVHPRPVRSGCDLVDPEILGQEQVAQAVDRIEARLGEVGAEGPALPALVLGPGEIAHPQVVPDPGPGEQPAPRRQLGPDPRPDRPVREAGLEGGHAAGLDPGRQHDQQAGARPFVGVQVEADVEALRPGVVDELEHVLGRSREGRPVIEVGDVDRPAAAAPDLDRLSERIEERVTERIAHVGVVEAAEPDGLGQEVGQLLRRGIGAGRVVEPGRQSECAFLEPLAQERPLVGHLGGARLDLVPAHGRDPQGRVADQVGDVDRDAAVIAGEVVGHRPPVVGDAIRAAVEARVEGQEVVEVVLGPERRVCVAIDPDDLRRDPLADLRLVARVGQDRRGRRGCGGR